MILKYCFSILCFLSLSFNVSANNKEKIINNLRDTVNQNFQFKQNINGKIETGHCTIEYPKKIFCIYKKNNKKILVSNGSSLVIKTISSYYRYPLKKTPLNLILDKYFLINKIYDLEEETKYKPHISFTIKEGNSEIDIFFDYQTFDLIGWRTKDIFQNINTTFISSIRKNQFIDKNLFSLPAPN